MEPVIQELAGITNYSIENSHETDCIKVVLETDVKEDIRVPLFYALADKKLPVLALSRLEKSLEDIFLELTGDGAEKEETEIEEAEDKETKSDTEQHAPEMEEGGNDNESDL